MSAGNKKNNKKRTGSAMKSIELEYLLHLPQDFHPDSGKKYPLILFLHGAGERGHDVQKVKKHGVAKIAEKKRNFPFIVISPQCPAGYYWNELDKELISLLDKIIAEYPVDTARVYLTGLSMGGFGTWHLAIKYPERFAAIAPVCGGGNPNLVESIKDMPIWVFHGAMDDVVPLDLSVEMVEALKEFGSSVEFTVYPDAGHDSWTETYNNDSLYEWFLSFRKNHSAGV